MRYFIPIALTAMLASPSAAQNTNQSNQANAVDPPTTVVAGPDTTLNNVAQPAIPAVPGENAAASIAPAAETELTTVPLVPPADEEEDDFPWGLLGLFGLIGLAGLMRR